MQIRPERIIVTSNYSIEQVKLFAKPFCPQTADKIAPLFSNTPDLVNWNLFLQVGDEMF